MEYYPATIQGELRLFSIDSSESPKKSNCISRVKSQIIDIVFLFTVVIIAMSCAFTFPCTFQSYHLLLAAERPVLKLVYYVTAARVQHLTGIFSSSYNLRFGKKIIIKKLFCAYL